MKQRMSKKQRRRLAKRALARSREHPVTHTGRLLHPAAAFAEAHGGTLYDAEHVTVDPESGKVLSLDPVDMFEGPPKQALRPLPITRRFTPNGTGRLVQEKLKL